MSPYVIRMLVCGLSGGIIGIITGMIGLPWFKDDKIYPAGAIANIAGVTLVVILANVFIK